MKNMKSFDFFQKITVEGLNNATVSGAIISLTATLLMIFLLIKEIIAYCTPIINKQTIVYHDPNGGKIKANFSIKIFNAPCPIVSIDQEDTIGSHVMDIKENLEKVRMGKDNNKIVGTFIPYKTELLEKSIKDEEGCYIKGFIPINKVPGDIHISFHNFREVWEYLKNNLDNNNLFKRLKLNHKLLSLSFGDKEITQQILNRFGLNEFTNSFTYNQLPSYEKIEMGHKDVKYNYNYYIKLIPHIFVDEFHGEEFIAYEYSLAHKTSNVESEEEMPIILIDYDISPIAIKITLEKKLFSRFLVNVCAIVGGIFVMFSILNKLINFFCELYSENNIDKPYRMSN
jgi:hypothetical protein